MAASEKWERKRLRELPVQIIDGDRSARYPKRSEFQNSGVLFLNTTNIVDDRLELDEAVYISEQKYSEIKKGRAERGDIFMTTRGSIGKVARFDCEHETALINAQILILRADPNQLDSRFLFHTLRSPVFKTHLANFASGSAQPQIPITDLREVDLPIPPLPVQRRIAGILSAYDELMENSQRRIRILEAMARALYREWFVHFRFPGHEKLPRVPSPLGDIPKDWEVTTFGELYNTGSGGTPSRSRPEYFENGTIDWVKSKELLDGFVLATEERITERALDESSARLFPANAVLIALYGATIGKLAILSRVAATNQACCAILPKRSPFGREFAFLTLLLNREKIISLRLGAAQQNISQVLLRNFECLKPADELVRRFSEQTAPFFDGILTLQRQIENLRQNRALLVPRLLSGQVNIETDLKNL